MKRMDENEITGLCFLAQVLVAEPNKYELLIELTLNPAKAKLLSRKLNQLFSGRSAEFKQSVHFLQKTFKQLQSDQITLGKIALAAEKMTKKRNVTEVYAGKTLLWGVSNYLSRDLRLVDKSKRKISQHDEKTIISVIKRVLSRNL